MPILQDLLRKLWSLVFGKEAGAFPAEIRSERWKDMGWQSDDPGRDIRCVGMLGPGMLRRGALLLPGLED